MYSFEAIFFVPGNDGIKAFCVIALKVSESKPFTPIIRGDSSVAIN